LCPDIVKIEDRSTFFLFGNGRAVDLARPAAKGNPLAVIRWLG